MVIFQVSEMEKYALRQVYIKMMPFFLSLLDFHLLISAVYYEAMC